MGSKRISLCLCVFLLATVLLANGTQEANLSNDTNEIKVVSLSPEATEIICALGGEKNLIGRTQYCDYPESILNITTVGDLYYPNIELIITLHPNAVIATSIISNDVVSKLTNAGINVYQLDYQNNGLEGCYKLIEEIGKILNKNNEAKELITSLQEKIYNIKQITQNVDKKSCIMLVTWGDWGDYAAPKNSYVDGAISAANGINIATDATLWTISREFLIAKDPDVVFITNDSNYVGEDDIKEVFISTEPYSILTASKSNNVFVLDGNSVNRMAVRIFDVIEEMARDLHPECFYEN